MDGDSDDTEDVETTPEERHQKQYIIETLFFERWDEATQSLRARNVTLKEVVSAIHASNKTLVRSMSARNPANFYKDFIRNIGRANANFPPSVFAKGYRTRQLTGDGNCFEFIRTPPGQTTPFVLLVPHLTGDYEVTPIESISIPLPSRKLGRTDEPWLIQVLVRLRVIETHLAIHSPHKIIQLDHLQMSVKLQRTEIDALFLATVQSGSTTTQMLVTCEAKGRRDDLLDDQIVGQARAALKIPALPIEIVLPIAVKAVSASRVRVVECASVNREQAADEDLVLRVSNDAVYELRPPVTGIGG